MAYGPMTELLRPVFGRYRQLLERLRLEMIVYAHGCRTHCLRTAVGWLWKRPWCGLATGRADVHGVCVFGTSGFAGCQLGFAAEAAYGANTCRDWCEDGCQ